ncbi:MAG: PAS domain-containing protein [Pseudomonadota bacterium]
MAGTPLIRALRGDTLHDMPMVIAPPGMPKRFILASGRRMANAAGKPLGAVVAMKDVTELHESRHQLARNEQRLRDITDNVPALIGHIDSACRFTFLNSPALHFYGKTGQNLIGQHVRAIYTPADFAKFGPFIARVLAGEHVEFEDEMQIAGKRKFFHAAYIPNRTPAGEVIGFYALALDITAQKIANCGSAKAKTGCARSPTTCRY